MSKIDINKLLVVDLYSGEYARKYIGHEDLNLDKNLLDGNYYGYCPPWDGVVISKLGAKSNNKYIDGITVIYVRKKEVVMTGRLSLFVTMPEYLDILNQAKD